MHFKVCLLFFFSSSLLFIHRSNAFNITRILEKHPDFSTFNNYLSQTGLARTINSRQTVTVLVVSNDAISPLSGKSQAVLKNIVSVHVILDYYDPNKFENLPNKTAQITTLFQSSGEAKGQQGFLKATVSKTKSVVIASATQPQGSNQGADLVKNISSQPHDISVLQISDPIIPVGIDDNNSNSTSPTKPPVPGPSPKNAPTPSDADPPAPGSAPTPSDPEAPAASPPKPADAPAADNTDSGTSTLRVGIGAAITIALSIFHSIVIA